LYFLFQLLLSAQSPFAPSLNPFEKSSLAFMGSSLMDGQLTSSCLTAYLKFRLFLSTENPATSTYRTLADVILRVFSNSIALLRYDKLVIAVGSVSSTHGVSGLEHCFQLKTIADARAIRRRILGRHFLSPGAPLQ
jgi:hypothetical protein